MPIARPGRAATARARRGFEGFSRSWDGLRHARCVGAGSRRPAGNGRRGCARPLRGRADSVDFPAAFVGVTSSCPSSYPMAVVECLIASVFPGCPRFPPRGLGSGSDSRYAVHATDSRRTTAHRPEVQPPFADPSWVSGSALPPFVVRHGRGRRVGRRPRHKPGAVTGGTDPAKRFGPHLVSEFEVERERVETRRPARGFGTTVRRGPGHASWLAGARPARCVDTRSPEGLAHPGSPRPRSGPRQERE